MPHNTRNIKDVIDDRGHGEVLLFVHAFPLNRQMWNSQVTASEIDCRVINVDLPGFGRNDSEPFTSIEEAADFLSAVLDQRGVTEPVTLCGLSMGGYIALAFAKRHPERLKRLILCDTRAAADSEEKKAQREALAQRVLMEGNAFMVESQPAALLSKDTFTHQPHVVDRVREMVRATAPATIAAALRAMAARPDMTHFLPQITVPTLVLCGDDDAITPLEEMQRLADQIPNGQYQPIVFAGHLPALENPAALTGAIEMFRRTT